MTRDTNQSEQNHDMVINEARQRDRVHKILLLLVSIISVAVLVYAALLESVYAEWQEIRRDYGDILVEKANDDWGRTLASNHEIVMKQIVVPGLNVTDRCITCHVGIDDPRMIDVSNPHAVHPGKFLQWHEPDKFGCTPCHQGQGLAVVKDDAHGRVSHWLEPLLTGEQAYTTCSKCHHENDLYGAKGDLYSQHESKSQIYQQEVIASVPGLDNPRALSVARGKQLVLTSGCLSCHQYRGRGGKLGPDISYVGDKAVHDFDFSHIHGEHSVANWLQEHFEHPAQVSPGTLMPDMGYTIRQITDLTNFMMSLHKKKMPADYTPMPPNLKGSFVSGQRLYAMYCSGCHGSDGHGSTVREYQQVRSEDAPPELMVPSLNNQDTLSVVSDNYLRKIISHGRQGSNMIGWSTDNDGGLLPGEIERITAYIRSWQNTRPDVASISSAQGEARIGKIVYTQNCASCHGADGQGGIGTSLSSPSFLSVASDQFLARTLIHGRPDTAMPNWSSFDSQTLSDIIAFMRTWQSVENDKSTTLALLTAGKSDIVSDQIGKTLYQANCLNCHGDNGNGDLGPSLSSQDFLTLVDDEYLYESISKGRPGAGMPAWQHFSNQDVASLIQYINSWQTKPNRKLSDKPSQGDWDAGRFIYKGACASCHGNNAEGSIGPQLANTQFLKAVKDTTLHQWIAYGRSGTAMRGFLRGQQGMVDLTDHQIDSVIAYLRSVEREGLTAIGKYTSGRPELGKLWFSVSCAPCHGVKGEGASGPSLANKQFLSAASSGYLMATLAMGRDGTEMRPVKDSPQSILALSSDQVNDVVAYLLSWETNPPSNEDEIAHNYVIPWNIEHGRVLYNSNCAGCHGVNGKAELQTEPGKLSAWAPELNNQDFLRAATDGFLQATIVKGRSGTSMRSFGDGSQGLSELSSDDIDDIVAYIRMWSTQPSKPVTIPAQQDAAEIESHNQTH